MTKSDDETNERPMFTEAFFCHPSEVEESLAIPAFLRCLDSARHDRMTTLRVRGSGPGMRIPILTGLFIAMVLDAWLLKERRRRRRE